MLAASREVLSISQRSDRNLTLLCHGFTEMSLDTTTRTRRYFLVFIAAAVCFGRTSLAAPQRPLRMKSPGRHQRRRNPPNKTMPESAARKFVARRDSNRHSLSLRQPTWHVPKQRNTVRGQSEQSAAPA